MVTIAVDLPASCQCDCRDPTVSHSVHPAAQNAALDETQQLLAGKPQARERRTVVAPTVKAAPRSQHRDGSGASGIFRERAKGAQRAFAEQAYHPWARQRASAARGESSTPLKFGQLHLLGRSLAGF